MIVYALIDPRNGAVRYIGKSHRTAHRRLMRHLSPCYLTGNTHKERWLRILLKLNLRPIVRVLENCSSPKELNAAEIRHIARMRSLGAKLTNATKGGDGGSGPHTEASKAKISRALRGKPKSETHRINASLAQVGRKHSDSTKLKWSLLRKQSGFYPAPRYGINNNKTKLTEEAVHEIRSSRGTVTQRSLGIKFGVSHTAIRYVQKGINWNHLRVREFPTVKPQ